MLNTHTVEQVVADPTTRRLLKYYAPQLQDSTGGTSHSIYRELVRKTGNNYLSTALSGLNTKLTDSRKRADKMGFGFNITLTHLIELWIQQQGRCAVTGVIMNFNSGSVYDKNPLAISIDRINNRRGYVRGNVRLLTHWANNAKSTWDESVFNNMITEIVNNHKHRV